MMNFLIDFITVILSLVSSIYLFGKLTQKHIKIKTSHVVLTLAFGVIQMKLNSNNIQWLSTLFTVTYLYFMCKQVYSCSYNEAQNYSIIIWSISLLIDIFLMLISASLNLMVIYETNTRLYKSIASIIMSLLLVGIGNIKMAVRFLNRLYKKMKKLNISTYHVLLFIIILIFLGVMSSNNMENQFMIIIFFAIGIAILFTIVMFISMNYQIVTLKITNEILEKNNEVNQKAIYQFRILKHNLESQLMGVKTVANKKAKELLDNLIKEYNESFYIKHDINSMPLGINGLVFEKLYKYNEDKIEISITNKIKSKILNAVGPRSYNLFCEALGVTLDNALESAKESKDKLVYIEFRENKDYVQMKIMNTFHGNIDLDKLGTVNYTSKSEGHGLGLYSLFGRKNLTITTSIKNNLFVNKIEVKKLKK